MAACSEEICDDSPPLLLKMGLCQKPLNSGFYVVGMHTTHARCWIQDRALGLAWCVWGQVAKHSGAPWAIWQASQASKMKQKEVSDTIYGRRWKAPATHYTILVRAFLSQSKTECSPDFWADRHGRKLWRVMLAPHPQQVKAGLLVKRAEGCGRPDPLWKLLFYPAVDKVFSTLPRYSKTCGQSS